VSDAWNDVLRTVAVLLPKLVAFVVILVVILVVGLSHGRTLATIAAAFILGIGIIAALNQVGIATTVTTPILIAVPAAVVGVVGVAVAVVGVGGGLIKPMQTRWESYLLKAESEAPKLKAQASSAPPASERVKERVAAARDSFSVPEESEGGATAVYDQSTDRVRTDL
jgi:hypothetical protein